MENAFSLSLCARNPKKETDRTVSTCHPSRRNRDDISRLLRRPVVTCSSGRCTFGDCWTGELSASTPSSPRRRVTVIYAYKWPGTPVHSATSTECIIPDQLIIRISFDSFTQGVIYVKRDYFFYFFASNQTTDVCIARPCHYKKR